jgi:hypothetical protein
MLTIYGCNGEKMQTLSYPSDSHEMYLVYGVPMFFVGEGLSKGSFLWRDQNNNYHTNYQSVETAKRRF